MDEREELHRLKTEEIARKVAKETIAHALAPYKVILAVLAFFGLGGGGYITYLKSTVNETRMGVQEVELALDRIKGELRDLGKSVDVRLEGVNQAIEQIGAPAPPVETPCISHSRIQVTSPKSGSTVGISKVVRGIVELQENEAVWVLAHRTGLEDQWWPQYNRPADIKGSNWTATCYFGRRDDIGATFEVRAVIVDANVSRQLQEYANKAVRRGDWPPIHFPTVKDCMEITVKKTSH